MMDVCRRDPHLLNVLEAFLSDAQVKLLVNEGMEASDESV